jgi:hypothetical protein
VPFRAQPSPDPVVQALEELRAVDWLLDGPSFAARTSVPDSTGVLGRLAVLSPGFSPLPSAGDREDEQDRDDLRITEALGHLERAIALTGGALWNGGISRSGAPWLLHTSVGMRHAARDYFERLVANDPGRFREVPPLAPLEVRVTSDWPARVVAFVAMLMFGGYMLLNGLPPLSLALLPLVAALLWLRTKNSKTSPRP